MLRLGDICVIKSGGTPDRSKDEYWSGDIPWVTTSLINYDVIHQADEFITKAGLANSSTWIVPKGTVLMAMYGQGVTRGRVGILGIDAAINQACAAFLIKDETLDPNFLFRALQHRYQDLRKISDARGGNQGNLSAQVIKEYSIPVPPFDVQKEILAEIDGYQKVINGARAVLESYRPHIPIHPDWEVVQLDEIIEEKPKNGYSGKPVDRVTGLKVLTLSATTSGTLDITKFKYLDEEIPANSACRCKKGDIYLQRGNTAELVGTAALFDVDEPNFIFPDLMIRVRADETKVTSRYLINVLQSQPIREFLTRNAVGAAGNMPKINQSIVESVPIPLPPLAVQQQIVAEIEAEQALVAANRELITRFEKKIQATLARIWGDAPIAGI